LILAQMPVSVTASPAFDRAEIQVVPGATLAVRIIGGTPPFVIVPSASNYDVDFDAARALVLVTGRSNGRGSISVIDGSGATASIPVLVAPPAGVVPDELRLTLAGSAVAPDFATAQIAAGLSRAAHLQTGASLTSAPPSPATLRPGDRLDLRVPVELHGNGAFVDVAGTTTVHLGVVALPPLEPGELMYSDDPENLPASADGVLFRDTLGAGEAARLYLYHASLVAGRHVTLALRAGSASTRVELLGASAGPSNDYLATGHAASVQYLRARRAQNSLVVDIDPGQPFLLPLSSRPLESDDLVAGVFDLRVLSGGPLAVLCIATTGSTDPSTLLDAPRVAGDGHLRTGTFALDAPPLSLALRVGEPEPAPISAGMPTITALRAPRALAGGYGVVQHLTITLENPGAAASDVYLYEIPSGNAVTTTLFFDGDPTPLEVACVKTAGARYLVRKFSVQAGARVQTGADYMTDGASSYPIEFGLSTVPPAAPDGCAAGAPAPEGTPST
jgi:hypothetical protein